MEHQNWNKTISVSKHQSHNQNLEKQVLNNKDIQTVRKPSDQHVSNPEGKKLNKILESESLDVPTDDVGFKRALLQARTQKGIKQKDFALKMGVKETQLRAWETGKVIPDHGQIAKMEKLLDCKLPRPHKPKLQLNIG